MRLTRVAVSSLRRFSAPFELAELQPGLNIFSGPNEAGKSTLVRAIRAAVFERHRSTVVEDLRPFGDAAASPSVWLEFTFAGRSYRLHKSFLGTKRCELQIDQQRLEGVAAEDALAELLGFRFAAKGASRAEHWGIPGLLWIDQGTGHEVAEVAGHAADHLRRALEGSVSEVVSTGGDEVVAEVRRRRDAWLTSTGKPTGEYQKALAEVTDLQTVCGDLSRRVQTYRAEVDRLRDERDAYAVEARDRAWSAYQKQEAAKGAELQALEGLQGERAGRELAVKQLQGTAELLAGQIGSFEAQVAEGRTREQARIESEAQLERELEALAEAERVQQTASAALQRSLSKLLTARSRAERQRLVTQRDAAARRLQEGETQLGMVQQQQAEAALLRDQALAERLPPGALEQLRSMELELRDIDIRRSAVATRLSFTWTEGFAATLDGQPMAAQGERLIVAPATLDLPGVGRVVVEPGGQDLPALVKRTNSLLQSRADLLQRLGLKDLAEAELRARSADQREAAARAAAAALTRLAPQGVERLLADLAEARASHHEAEKALARSPAGEASGASTSTTEAALDLPLAQAEAAHRASEQASEQAQGRLGRAREQCATARSRRDAAVREWETVARQLADPQRQAAFGVARQRLAESAAAREAAQQAVSEIEARIAASNPQALRLDVQRLGLTAAALLKDHHERERRILQLEASLATTGAEGLEEDLASRQAELARAQRRADEMKREAEALDFLLERLQARRQALTRRLQAPLQARMEHYLPLLFPGAEMTLDEALVPAMLRRRLASATANSPMDELASFSSLSQGAREQLGLVCRLAYADLLAAAERPTLLILDDALVHSDEERLGCMKRVLFDAAQRHQVLIFTCHPGRWRDLGVQVRSLAH